MISSFVFVLAWGAFGIVVSVLRIVMEVRAARELEQQQALRRWNDDRVLRLSRWNTEGPWGAIYRSHDRGRPGGCEGTPP